MSSSLHRTALVAGGSQGLGAAVAEGLRANDIDVYICSRSVEAGPKAIQCDVTDSTAIEELFQKLPPIDILVTNAGGPAPGSFTDIDDAEWQRSFELTFMSSVRLIRQALPHMKQQQWGRIIAMTSTSVKQPIPNLITSNAMRAAVANMIKTLAREVAADGITANIVAPGMFETNRMDQLMASRAKINGTTSEQERATMAKAIPTGRFGTVGEFASAVAYLASEEASYVNGNLLSVDGGFTQSL